MGQLILEKRIKESELDNFPNYSKWIHSYTKDRGLNLKDILDKPFVHSFLIRNDLFHFDKIIDLKYQSKFNDEVTSHIEYIFFNSNITIDKKLVLLYLKTLFQYKLKSIDEDYNLILLSNSLNSSFNSDLRVDNQKFSTYHTIENNAELKRTGKKRDVIYYKNDNKDDVIEIKDKSSIEVNGIKIFIKRVNYDKKVVELIKSNIDFVQIGINKSCDIIFDII